MNNRSVKHIVGEIERKQLETAKLAEELRKSVRLREYFGLPMEGMVSLEPVYRLGDKAIVECRVKIDGTVVRFVSLRREIDRKKIPDDVMAIIKECMRPKPHN